MSGLKHWLALWIWATILALPGSGQALPEPAAVASGQAPPAFGVLDTGGFFNRHASALKRISDRIRTLEQDRGYMIYLVLEPVLITTNAADRASELRQSWVPGGNGLVVVFESDSRNFGIGRDLVDPPADDTNPTRVPSFETAAILTRALDATDPKLAPDVFLETLVEQLVTGFEDYFKRRETPPPAARSMRMGLLVLGTLALLGLGGIGVGGLLRHSSMAEVRTYRFPKMDGPERLGAPCGAQVTARKFTPPA